ncbi:DNA-binding transcriptional LysR family regulator [Thermocatellispora tengchongensis]|uniref:DNA-binding transcriptional LysR family regulator n=1 Tax=Thermocatellispora tengchongensis TaxID=1073253 RepID=A0A840PA02_9ACTN|nr:LysR substrate-binding domain-containing protein [Thermocatellispora tengchongensis]MBB5134250.1 DNA-binding transcriptional LysR family regulator [Thermocatellispora tengchongensis]
MHVPKLLDGRLKLRHLVLIDVLSRQGSVVAAATHLHVAQPVVSRALQEVERILGVRLYDRGPRGLTPTIYGSAFTTHARAVLAQLNQAGEHIAELSNATRGTVVVGSHLGGTNLLLPRAINRLKQSHPLVTVIIREAPLESLLTDLDTGRLDFLVGRPAQSAARPSAECEVLYAEPLQVVARAGHPAFGMPAIDLGGLFAFPWILPGDDTRLRAELETAFANRRLPLPENRVEGTAILTVRQILESTDTITVLPFLLVHNEPALRAFPITIDEAAQTVSLTTPAGRPPTPAAGLLLDHVRSVGRELQELVGQGRAAPG